MNSSLSPKLDKGSLDSEGLGLSKDSFLVIFQASNTSLGSWDMELKMETSHSKRALSKAKILLGLQVAQCSAVLSKIPNLVNNLI